MDIILEELTAGLPDARQFARLVIRLLVAMGAALFVLAPAETGMTSTDVSRVIQGLATGIGFIGAGAILKLSVEREIRGLTTAAGLWMTAAMVIGRAHV